LPKHTPCNKLKQKKVDNPPCVQYNARMKNLLLATATLVLLAACQGPQGQLAPTVDIGYGWRNYDAQNDWEQTDEQQLFTVQADFCGKDGFGPEVGFSLGQNISSDGFYENRPVSDTTSTVRELYFGLRKNWMLTDRWQVFASGGVSAFSIDTDIDPTYTSVISDRDTGYAPYAQVGSRWFMSDNWSLAGLYRQHFGASDSDIFVNSPSLNGGTLFVLLGYSF